MSARIGWMGAGGADGSGDSFTHEEWGLFTRIRE
jgi:hypothetical protein